MDKYAARVAISQHYADLMEELAAALKARDAAESPEALALAADHSRWSD